MSNIGNKQQQLIPWLLPLALLVIWHIFTTGAFAEHTRFIAPLTVFSTAVELIRSGELLESILISSKRAFLGFLIGGSFGLILGLINGISRYSELFLDSTIQMMRTIPHLALVPLVILWFGIAEPAKLILIVLGVFFPIYLNTFH